MSRIVQRVKAGCRHSWVPLDYALIDVGDEPWIAVVFVCTNEECNARIVTVERLHNVGMVVEENVGAALPST